MASIFFLILEQGSAVGGSTPPSSPPHSSSSGGAVMPSMDALITAAKIHAHQQSKLPLGGTGEHIPMYKSSAHFGGSHSPHRHDDKAHVSMEIGEISAS